MKTLLASSPHLFRIIAALVIGIAVFEKAISLFRDWTYFADIDTGEFAFTIVILVVESLVAVWVMSSKSDWLANFCITALFLFYSIVSGILYSQGTLVCPCFPVSNISVLFVFIGDLAIFCIAMALLSHSKYPTARISVRPKQLGSVLFFGLTLAISGPVVDLLRCKISHSGEIIASIGRIDENTETPESWKVVSLELVNRTNSAIIVSGFHPRCGVKSMVDSFELQPHVPLPCTFAFRLAGEGKAGAFQMGLTCKIGSQRVSQFEVPVRVRPN